MRWMQCLAVTAILAAAAGCSPKEEGPPPGGAPEQAAAPSNAPAVGMETANANAPAANAPAGESSAARPGGKIESAGATGSGPTASPEKVDPSRLKKTPSGLQYAILKPGGGAGAKDGQTVTVQYTGWLKSTGKKFDSSYDHPGPPFQFPLGQHAVIPGWDEGVKGMKVGEKRQLVIPSRLGYAESGTPDGAIPPNADLIFDVELLKTE